MEKINKELKSRHHPKIVEAEAEAQRLDQENLRLRSKIKLLERNLEEARGRQMLSDASLSRASASASKAEAEWSGQRARIEAEVKEEGRLRRMAEEAAAEARGKTAAAEVELR